MNTNAVIYLSTATNDPQPLEAQRSRCRANAEHAGLSVTDEYEDIGFSRTTLDRPSLTRLRQAAVRGAGRDRNERADAIRVVIVESSDQLSRDAVQLRILTEEFERAGTEVHYAVLCR